MVQRKMFLIFAIVFAVCISSQSTWATPPDHVDLPDHAAANENQDSNDDGETPVLGQEDMGQGETWTERIRQPGARSGIIKTKKHVYYCDPAEDVSLSVVLPHSLKGYWEGDADAWLVVQLPEDASPDGGAMIPMMLEPADSGAPEERHVIQDVSMADVPCENLEGAFQIALILTDPEEEGCNPDAEPSPPLNLECWYNGFQGLIAFSKINFSVVDNEEDSDFDGEVDGDSDGDGYQDE